jgi:hypothetical protein
MIYIKPRKEESPVKENTLIQVVNLEENDI